MSYPRFSRFLTMSLPFSPFLMKSNNYTLLFLYTFITFCPQTNKVNNQYTKSRMHIVRFEPNTKTGTTLLVWGREGYNNTCNDIQFANYRDTLLSNRFKSDVEQSGFRVFFIFLFGSDFFSGGPMRSVPSICTSRLSVRFFSFQI